MKRISRTLAVAALVAGSIAIGHPAANASGSCGSLAETPYASGGNVYALVHVYCDQVMDSISISPYLSGPYYQASGYTDTCYGVSSCSRWVSHNLVAGNWTASVTGSGTSGGYTTYTYRHVSNPAYLG